MLCPRCADAELSAGGECPTCGFSTVAKGGIEPEPDPLEQLVLAELGASFTLQALLHRTEWSAVYLAKPADKDTLEALKVVVPAGVFDTVAARFRSEVQRSASLRHPNIVPISRFGVCPTFVWYSMEHVPGRTLAASLAQDERRDLAAGSRMVTELAGALDYAHRRGIIHGNLKPSNILIDTKGPYRIADFGVRRALAPIGRQESETEWAGTADYLAPEQLGPRRAENAGVDQYALAAIAYQFLTGVVPGAEGRTPRPAVPDASTAGRAAGYPALAPHVEATLRRALDPDPARRFDSVLDFATFLEQEQPVLHQAPVVTKPRATPKPSGEVLIPVADVGLEPAPDPPRRWFMPVLLGTTAFLLLVGGTVGWIVWRKSTERPLLGGLPEPIAERPRVSTPPPVTGTATDTASSPPGVSRRPAVVPPPTEPVRRAAPSPPAQAELFVNSTPWGQLFVDDSLFGNTPKGGISIAPGRHTLRVVREGFAPFEQVIDLRPGEKLRLTDIVLTPRNP